MKRIATKYPGVFYRLGTRLGGQGEEKIFYAVFKRDGKVVEAKVGRQYADDMTPAKAAAIRAELVEGKRLTRQEARDAEEANPTIGRLWVEYQEGKPAWTGQAADRSRFSLYLQKPFGHKRPAELVTLDLDRLRLRLLREGKSPQTVKHTIALLRRIIRFGVKKSRCPMPDPSRLHFEMPEVDNQKTESLTPAQAAALLKALDEEADQHLASLIRLALCTGIRPGALMALRWADLDFERGFITLQGATAKKRRTETVPMNPTARTILEGLDRVDSFVFPGKDPSKPRTTLRRMARRVKLKAGLPEDYRPLYCLRHTFASWLASSGLVSMYELQRLLTHEDPKMTQRYAHLHDDALRRASGVADDLFQEAVNAGPAAPASGKVVPLRKGGRTARKAG